jgi:hypothetical protein
VVVLRKVVGMEAPGRELEGGARNERGKAYYKLIGKIQVHLSMEEEELYEGFAENNGDNVRKRWIEGRGEGQQKEVLQEFSLI